jgi:hypothetical protein
MVVDVGMEAMLEEVWYELVLGFKELWVEEANTWYTLQYLSAQG